MKSKYLHPHDEPKIPADGNLCDRENYPFAGPCRPAPHCRDPRFTHRHVYPIFYVEERFIQKDKKS